MSADGSRPPEPKPKPTPEARALNLACKLATRKARRRRRHKHTTRKLKRRQLAVPCVNCGSIETQCRKCGCNPSVIYDPTHGGIFTLQEAEANERSRCKWYRSKIEEKYRAIGFDDDDIAGLDLDRYERTGGSWRLWQILCGDGFR